MHPPTSRAAVRQRGAAMAAFTVSALPLLFCGLLVVEAARWHMTRQMLNLALLEAARAGTTAHARPAAIEQAFETALLPLFHPPGRHRDPRARMRASFLYVAQQSGAPPWRIDVASPTADAYADFGDASLRIPGASGRPAIRNDYQAEQHLRRRRMGWPAGRGPRSGQTVFEANMLRLRLSYAHAPWVPGVRALLRGIAAMRSSRDPAARAGMLVMEMEMALPMQSHPVLWRGVAAGGAKRPLRPAAAWRPPGPEGSPDAGSRYGVEPLSRTGVGTGIDTGVATGIGTGIDTGIDTGMDTGIGTGIDTAAHTGIHAGASNKTDRAGDSLVPGADQRQSDDPACGVLLCCADR